MKPKSQPMPLPGEFTPYGELAFQPYLDKRNGVVVTGGPNGIFLIKVNEVVYKLQFIPAQVRISGFTVHSGVVFVQDGAVLSRWGLVSGECQAAINLLDKSRIWQSGTGAPDWKWLHTLSADRAALQQQLRRARRKVEWLALLEACETLVRDTTTGRSADDDAKLRSMIAEIGQLLGGRDQVRGDLDAAETAAAALIFSPAVVREHQVGAKAAALVFVIGRDGTLHPLDDALKHMGTSRIDKSARPALALGEWETDAYSDDLDCRVYYVTGEGVVRAVDGNSLPLASVGAWPARGRASLQPGIRPRIDRDLLWGSGAQDTGVFALDVNTPNSASRVRLPLTEDWRWLETTKVGSFALACTNSSARLIAYGESVLAAERWRARPGGAPYYSSFLEIKGDPLFVVEFDCESATSTAGPGYRVVVANTVDAPDRSSVSFYPPVPETIASGVLEAFSTRTSPPASIRTQVTVSLQDAYLVARDCTKRDQIGALLQDGPKSWSTHREKVSAKYGSLQAAAASIGEIELPPMAGNDALYCYPVGTTLTREQKAKGSAELSRIRDLLQPLIVHVTVTLRLAVNKNAPLVHGPVPLPATTATLRFGNGETLRVDTTADGEIMVPYNKRGQTVTLDNIPVIEDVSVTVSSCTLENASGNHIEVIATMSAAIADFKPIFHAIR